MGDRLELLPGPTGSIGTCALPGHVLGYYGTSTLGKRCFSLTRGSSHLIGTSGRRMANGHYGSCQDPLFQVLVVPTGLDGICMTRAFFQHTSTLSLSVGLGFACTHLDNRWVAGGRVVWNLRPPNGPKSPLNHGVMWEVSCVTHISCYLYVYPQQKSQRYQNCALWRLSSSLSSLLLQRWSSSFPVLVPVCAVIHRNMERQLIRRQTLILL